MSSKIKFPRKLNNKKNDEIEEKVINKKEILFEKIGNMYDSLISDKLKK